MQKKQEYNSLIWFNLNLRTKDNTLLWEALKNSQNCFAVYCIDPKWFQSNELGFQKMSQFRAKFLLESLEDLASQLAELGIPFSISMDSPIKALPELIKSHNITHVYLQKEWTYEERTIVDNTKAKCPNTITWIEQYDQFLIHPEDIPFDIPELPFMFTEFRKKVEKSLVIRPELKFKTISSSIKTTKAKIPSLESLGFKNCIFDERTAFPFKGGATYALGRLQNYFWETDAIRSYKETRNGLSGLNYSSKLSPWLANGCISAKTIYHELIRYETERGANESTYWLTFELLWRDFFKYVSMKYGNRIFYSQGIRSKKNNWKRDRDSFTKWCTGKTNSPFVNANMQELNATGWMSNRGRQNVASYLTKTLEIDWRWGASYFESLLLDYDVHSNYGNWMYIAGVGNDPRDRYFNVDKQAKEYDPDEKYRKLWLTKQTSI